jgi:3-dehydroquinate synthase
LKTITVKTESKKYPVYIGNRIVKLLPELIAKQKLSDRVFVIIDNKVEKIYGSSIKQVVNDFAQKKYYYRLTSTEKIKSFKTVSNIFNKLYEQNFGKDSLLIAIGGGTIGDVAGFVASTYMRGISLIHIPTTLLSAVDSSIGGKTGINFLEAKNLIGTFYQPNMVLIDSNFINSLSPSELISGFGEIVKYSYLTDKNFYSTLLEKHLAILKKDQDFLDKIIYESVKIKSAIISQDEKEETGLRKILNLGHTFAHAYESGTSYKLSHGKAVMFGIINSINLSFDLELINKNQYKYMLELPMKFRSFLSLKKTNPETILKLMRYDKKNREGRIKFVLIKNYGEILVDVPAANQSIIKSLKCTEQIWFKRATAGL